MSRAVICEPPTVADVVPTASRIQPSSTDDQMVCLPVRVEVRRGSIFVHHARSILCKTSDEVHPSPYNNQPWKRPIMEEHPGPPFNLCSKVRFYPMLKHPMIPLPKCERCSLGRVPSFEEPKPLLRRNISTSNTLSLCRADHRHIKPDVYVTGILGNTGGCLAYPRIRDIAKIRVVLNLRAKHRVSHFKQVLRSMRGQRVNRDRACGEHSNCRDERG